MKLPICISILAFAASAHADDASKRRVSMSDAIELAQSKNPDLAAAKDAVNSAEAHRAGLSAKRLPQLSVETNVNIFYEPYKLDFGGTLFTLYEQVTTVSGARISQPLTGLAYLSELVGAANHEAKAVRADYDRARLDSAYNTADAFLRVLEARAAADVARRSVADIASELDQALKLRQADTLTNIDVLRLQSRRAAADQAAVRADTTSQVAIAQLAVTIGLREGEPLDLIDDLPATPPPLAMTLEQAQSRALTARPELRAAGERIAAARDLVISRRDEYLPDLHAVAVYSHNTGVQPFQPANAGFLGLQLSWNVWDWGARHAAVQEAESTQTRAHLTANALADHVRFDVRRRWLEAKATFDNLASAQTQLQSAEEAFRLQRVKFDAAAATTTDVLDAETDVARARLQSALARYDYYLDLVALARAVGDIPSVK